MAEGMISMDARQVGRIARGIRETSKPAWLALRARLKEIGETVASDARGVASSPNVKIEARATAAGNVRVSVVGLPGVPQENKGLGHVSHPVFAKRGSPRYTDRSKWTNKNSPPARLLPTYARRKEWALAEMERAYLDAFDRAWAAGGER